MLTSVPGAIGDHAGGAQVVVEQVIDPASIRTMSPIAQGVCLSPGIGIVVDPPARLVFSNAEA